MLKFSSLVTDVYFHYTPSQIMMGALSFADQGLAERIIQETFKHTHEDAESSDANNTKGTTDGAANGASSKARKAETRREKIGGADVRDKVLASVKSCREMLAAEPPERFNEYWGTVCWQPLGC